MVKIEKVEFNTKETEIIEKFFDILSRLEEIEFSNDMEDEIYSMSKCNSEFFYNNENVILMFSEE